MTWLTRIAVIAPVVHIGLCYYYLFLRSFGFGSNVTEFLAAGDVFTVGLSKLLSTYLLFIMGAVFGHIWTDRDPLQISGRTSFELHESFDKPFMRFVIRSIPYIAGIGIVLNLVLHKRVLLEVLVFLFIPGIVKFVFSVTAKNNLPRILALPAIVILIGLSNLTAQAYSEGFRFRHRSPAYFASSNAACANGTIMLFATGERFVATTPAGERVLIDDECGSIMKFPDKRVVLDVF